MCFIVSSLLSLVVMIIFVRELVSSNVARHYKKKKRVIDKVGEGDLNHIGYNKSEYERATCE